MELLVEAEIIPEKRLKDLMTETDEIIAATASFIKNPREKQKSPKE
jgi:hypothetical protein